MKQYYTKVLQMIRYSGMRNVGTLRESFQDLLEQYTHSKNLVVVPEKIWNFKVGSLGM
jgi:hypothetical protein